MPSFEEIALADLAKHPKAFIMYAICIGLGWLAPKVTSKFFPDDCHEAVTRLQNQNDQERHRSDSVQRSKDILYEDLLTEKRQNSEHKTQDKRTDSLLHQLAEKAESLKLKHHVTIH